MLAEQTIVLSSLQLVDSIYITLILKKEEIMNVLSDEEVGHFLSHAVDFNADPHHEYIAKEQWVDEMPDMLLGALCGISSIIERDNLERLFPDATDLYSISMLLSALNGLVGIVKTFVGVDSQHGCM